MKMFFLMKVETFLFYSVLLVVGHETMLTLLKGAMLFFFCRCSFTVVMMLMLNKALRHELNIFIKSSFSYKALFIQNRNSKCFTST